MPQDSRSLNHRLVARFVPVERWEVVPVLWAAAFFACILASSFLLRGLRESVASGLGQDEIAELWTGTAIATVMANPVFWWLVNSMPRRIFAPVRVLVLAACQLILFACFSGMEKDTQLFSWVQRSFYVWLSTANVLSTCLAWIVFVDIFSEAGARRLFGFIAVGGTLGALLGSSAASAVVSNWGESALFLSSTAVLLLALGCLWRLQAAEQRLVAVHPQALTGGGSEVASGGVFAGIRAAMRNPTLLAIIGFVLFTSLAGTALYHVQIGWVREVFASGEERTLFNNRLNTWVQTVTFLIQIFLAGNILKRFGVGAGLGALPATLFFGFMVLAWMPALSVFFAVEVVRKGVHYGFTTPSRNVLFTVLGAEERYKAKSFTDTFTLRIADVAWAWVLKLALGLAAMATVLWALLPATVLWFGLALFLARRHRRNLQEIPGSGGSATR